MPHQAKRPHYLNSITLDRGWRIHCLSCMRPTNTCNFTAHWRGAVLAVGCGVLSGAPALRCRPALSGLWMAVPNDVPERTKSFIHRFRIGKYFGNVRVKDHHDRALRKPTGVFSANAAG